MPLPQPENLSDREFAFSNAEFRLLAEIAHTHTGIVLSDNKKDMVYSRLVRRVRALRLSGFADYCALMQGPEAEAELGNLVNAITTNLTRFFREAHHFEHLQKQLLPPILTDPPSPKRLRIWSAGCSAGMEAYSIAMVLAKALPDPRGWDARILATDIDSNMLATGEAGEYPLEQRAHIPTEYHGEICSLPGNTHIRMSEHVRAMIAFRSLNLLDTWPMRGKFDAIFCRNVVIYFDKKTQSTLFNRMADQLQPHGFLYIGHSENLFQVCDRFELVGRTIYRKRH